MIISNSKKFIYIHLEKCGGTSIEYSLKPQLNSEDIFISSLTFEEDYLEKYYMKKNNLWKHASAEVIKRYLNGDWDNFYKFATVRNPKELMISLYKYDHDFFINNNINTFTDVQYDESIEKSFILIDKKLITSSTHLLYFAQSVLDNTGINGFISKIIYSKDPSIRSQISRLDNTVEIFDIKQIDTKWDYILNKINIKDKIVLQHLNKSNSTINVNLNQETLDLIYDNFYDDYKSIPSITGIAWS